MPTRELYQLDLTVRRLGALLPLFVAGLSFVKWNEILGWTFLFLSYTANALLII